MLSKPIKDSSSKSRLNKAKVHDRFLLRLAILTILLFPLSMLSLLGSHLGLILNTFISITIMAMSIISYKKSLSSNAMSAAILSGLMSYLSCAMLTDAIRSNGLKFLGL